MDQSIRIGTAIAVLKGPGFVAVAADSKQVAFSSDHQKTHLVIDKLNVLANHAVFVSERLIGDLDNIFVCGYSFPETDVFFRYLFAVGGSGIARLLRRFYVFNPALDTEVRFRSLLGPAIEDRFQFIPKKFHEAIWQMEELVGY